MYHLDGVNAAEDSSRSDVVTVTACVEALRRRYAWCAAHAAAERHAL